MKKLLFLLPLTLFTTTFGQVGINTESPKSTLDVVSSPTDLTKVDGLMTPRLTRAELTNKGNSLYGSDQKSTLIYITDTTGGDAAGQRINMIAPGYYYFDGAIWQGFGASGVDKTDDAFINDSEGAIVKLGTRSDGTTARTELGSFGISDNGYMGMGTLTPPHRIYIKGTGGENDDLTIESNSNGQSAGTFRFMRGRGTTPARTAVTSGSVLGNFQFLGYDGANDIIGADIRAVVNGTVSTNSVPVDMIFGIVDNTGNVPGEKLRISHSGNIGINESAPKNKLHINNGTTAGAIRIVDGTQGAGKVLTSNADGVGTWSTPTSINTGANAITKNGTILEWGGALTRPTLITGITNANNLGFRGATAAESSITIGTSGGTSGGVILGNASHGIKRGFPILGENNNVGVFTNSADIYLSTNASQIGEFVLKDNGDVGIGTATPTQKLHVIGNILASGTITPDYVFEKHFEGFSSLNPDYKMISLAEVESFTKKNKHLPGFPSAKEVEKNGGIVINRQVEIQLEKIEELYLHLIQQDKQIKAQKEQIDTLINLTDALQKRIDNMK